MLLCGAVAQLEERVHGMHEVRGSSPLSSTMNHSSCTTRFARVQDSGSWQAMGNKIRGRMVHSLNPNEESGLGQLF